MGHALTRVGNVVHAVTTRPAAKLPARVLPSNWQGGLSSQRMKSFRQRLDLTLADVATIEPGLHVDLVRSEMLQAALDPNNGDLTSCSNDSLAQFLLHAARTRLRIGSELQPVVDRDEFGTVVLIPVEGVKGIVRLLKETGGAREIHSGVVFEADDYVNDITSDNGLEFRHNRNFGVRDRGPIVAYYAIARLPGVAYEWVSKEITPAQLEQIRRASPSADHRCWRDYLPRMGEVSALRALGAAIPEGPALRRTPEPPAARPTPMPGLPLDEYASPLAGDGNDLGDAVWTVAGETTMSLQEALSARLPEGVPDYGRRTLRDVPDSVLRRFVKWAHQQPYRLTDHARLLIAIRVVTEWRGDAPASSSSTGSYA